MSGPLTKVAEIELLGERFDLAKNGGFCLCRTGLDAYGRASATLVPIGDWLSRVDSVQAIQALLDALGDAFTRLQTHRDHRLGAGKEKGA